MALFSRETVQPFYSVGLIDTLCCIAADIGFTREASSGTGELDKKLLVKCLKCLQIIMTVSGDK